MTRGRYGLSSRHFLFEFESVLIFCVGGLADCRCGLPAEVAVLACCEQACVLVSWLAAEVEEFRDDTCYCMCRALKNMNCMKEIM